MTLHFPSYLTIFPGASPIFSPSKKHFSLIFTSPIDCKTSLVLFSFTYSYNLSSIWQPERDFLSQKLVTSLPCCTSSKWLMTVFKISSKFPNIGQRALPNLSSSCLPRSLCASFLLANYTPAIITFFLSLFKLIVTFVL